jgi:hypothetical protein
MDKIGFSREPEVTGSYDPPKAQFWPKRKSYKSSTQVVGWGCKWSQSIDLSPRTPKILDSWRELDCTGSYAPKQLSNVKDLVKNGLPQMRHSANASAVIALPPLSSTWLKNRARLAKLIGCGFSREPEVAGSYDAPQEQFWTKRESGKSSTQIVGWSCK